MHIAELFFERLFCPGARFFLLTPLLLKDKDIRNQTGVISCIVVEAARRSGWMRGSEQRRTEAAIRHTQLLCDAAVYPGQSSY